MVILNSSMLILILLGPFILRSKAWELNKLCQQTCWGFDCVKQKPTQIELCSDLEKNRLKCCSQYTSRNTTTTSKPCQEDAKSEFKEKKRKKKQEGWFLNDACQTACYLFSCLFGTKPTEEELCERLTIRYNNCCSEDYSTTMSTTHENTGGFFTELFLSDPESELLLSEPEPDPSSASQEQRDKNVNPIDISPIATNPIDISPIDNYPIDISPTIEIPSTTIESEESEEVYETTTYRIFDPRVIVDFVSTKKTRPRSRKPNPNRKGKNQKYVKIPD